MLLIRDLVDKKIHIPDNIALAVIPLYNIGGALNRSSFSRVNQNGPEAMGSGGTPRTSISTGILPRTTAGMRGRLCRSSIG
jgi:hypothetical protein